MCRCWSTLRLLRFSITGEERTRTFSTAPTAHRAHRASGTAGASGSAGAAGTAGAANLEWPRTLTGLATNRTNPCVARIQDFLDSQDIPHELHLVGQRSFMALVDSGDLGEPTPENLAIEAMLGGESLGEVPLAAPSALRPTEASGPALATNLYSATIDAGWVNPGLSLRVKASNRSPSEARSVVVGAKQRDGYVDAAVLFVRRQRPEFLRSR